MRSERVPERELLPHRAGAHHPPSVDVFTSLEPQSCVLWVGGGGVGVWGGGCYGFMEPSPCGPKIINSIPGPSPL